MRRATPAAGVPRPGLLYRAAAWIGLIVMRIQRWQFDIQGLHHIPAAGGCIIAANHNSFWDFFAVGRAPYLTLGRPLRILAKQSLFELPVFGSWLRRTGCIPVDRGGGGAAFDHALGSLAAGEMVLVLPEGTISRSFDLLTLRTGAARMAMTAGVPIIPAVTWGSQRFATSGRAPRWHWKLPITVRYGAALRPSADDDPLVLTMELRERLQVLLDAAIATYPDGTPAGAWWVPQRLGGGAADHASVESEYRERRATWRRRRRRRP